MNSLQSETLKMSEEQLKEAIIRLCHFVPTKKGKERVLELHSFLVLQSMASREEGTYSSAQIKEAIHQRFKLHFEIEEIEPALQYLLASGQIGLASMGVYSISPRKRSEIKSQIEEVEVLERKIFDDWANSLKDKYPLLSTDELKDLKHDLKQYLISIIKRHGAECSALIYQSKELGESVSRLPDNINDILPSRPSDLNRVRLIELPLFVKELSSDRIKYLRNLLDASYTTYMLHIDKNCSALIQPQLEGITLYLDTNFLGSLSGRDGGKLEKSAKVAVKIAKRLKCTLLISQKTVDEWNYSMDIAKRQLRRYPSVSQDFARIGAKYMPRQSFTTAYWTKYAQTGMSTDDFVNYYGDLDTIRREHDINIKGKWQEEIEKSEELKEQISKLNLVAYKPLKVAQHDAFHRLLILRHRKATSPRTILDTKTWFLTQDSSLPRFDRVARKSPKGIPFCLLTCQWIQMMRPFLPRTEDYDDAFIYLLASPYLRIFPSLPSDIQGKITARVSLYRPSSTALLVRMLINEHLAEQLRSTEDEDKQFEFIDSAAAGIASEMEIELKNIKEESEKRKIHTAQVEKQKEALCSSLEEALKRSSEMEEELDKKWAEEKKAREEAEKAKANQRKWIIRIVIGGVALVIIIIILFYCYLK